MPIYEYQCAACGQIVERWQKVSEAPLTECPACGGSLSKLISSCAFHLKGGGWYVTDYGGNRQASGPDKSDDANGADTAKTAPEAPKEAAKTETAPAPAKIQ
jgi:putative FmdB family regulatory protein